MPSEQVLDHFRNPRNAGELPDATAKVQVSNPVCADVLQLAVRVEGGRITDARFLCRGCSTAIACASFLTSQIQDKTIADARNITARQISDSLGGLSPATYHGAQLAEDALGALLDKLKTR